MVNAIAITTASGLSAQAGLLAAVAEVESRGNPPASAVNGDVELLRQADDRAEAEAMARRLAANGLNFDAGLAQVNSANHARLGLDTRSVFDLCANLRVAVAVLDECRARALRHRLEGPSAVPAALSCDNTGSPSRSVSNGYVAAVRAALTRGVGSREPGLTRGTEPTPGFARRRSPGRGLRAGDGGGVRLGRKPGAPP